MSIRGLLWGRSTFTHWPVTGMWRIFLQKCITCTITATAIAYKSSNASFIKTGNTFTKALLLLQLITYKSENFYKSTATTVIIYKSSSTSFIKQKTINY